MIPFLKYSKLYAAISLIALAIGTYSVITFGFRYSVEFIGGSDLRYKANPPISAELVRSVLEKQEIEGATVSVSNGIVDIRTPPLSEIQERDLRNALSKEANTKIEVLRSETVGPTMSQDAVRKTVIASGLGVLGILLYVAYAFRNFTFAIAAVIALFHDVLILIGSYSLLSRFFGAELDTLFVTATLTTMSFSVHDTIVMYDQLRFYIRKHGTREVGIFANIAITETIVRSLNNSLTIIFMLLALALLGGETIRFFAISLLIGTIVGTYSSPFVSMPIAVWLIQRKHS
ncbi:MAG: protein translocase subunit SecF [Patescibacteria group bacterium]|nr:protein translocase subunit SecF [Patescibacteria group bacterium]